MSTNSKNTAQPKTLLVIAGPTAIGKTTLAIQLAKHYNCEILSADSRQFFREMNIGTAKPDAEELAAAPHHFIDSLSIDDTYSVGDYERDALKKLEDVFSTNDIAVLVGGSGLYIKALCEGLDVFPDVPEVVKVQLEKELEESGLATLEAELKEKDPEYYMEVDRSNSRRILRALSVIRTTGKTFSSFRTRNISPRPFQCIYIALTSDREKLYERINLRVDKMLEAGLLEEVKELYPKRAFKSLQTVGYQEFFKHFDEELSLEEAVELVKRNSRRYAKRQMTWFRNQQPAGAKWHYFAPDDLEAILNIVSTK
ncbi:MAG: tRNA dimethylallyltransferase [Saprospiraceae bacterium]|jgi:tRNA dimethylallyltransferase